MEKINTNMSKKQTQNILVPFDNSPNSIRSLDYALDWAKIIDAKITLVHVISYHKALAKIVGPYRGTLISHVGKFMHKAEMRASKLNVKVEKKVLYGNVAEELLKLVKQKKFDLVIVGRRGTSHITGPTLGSVSNALVQNLKMPIIVIT